MNRFRNPLPFILILRHLLHTLAYFLVIFSSLLFSPSTQAAQASDYDVLPPLPIPGQCAAWIINPFPEYGNCDAIKERVFSEVNCGEYPSYTEYDAQYPFWGYQSEFHYLYVFVDVHIKGCINQGKWPHKSVQLQHLGICPAGSTLLTYPVTGCAVPKCPAHQFRGPVSHECKNRCPADQYLTKAGTCSPLTECNPQQQNCSDADPEQGPPDNCSGNPINTATGNKFQTEVDSNWAPGLSFNRYYNSGNLGQSGFGLGWTHSYSAHIVKVFSNAPVRVFLPPPAQLVDPDWQMPLLNEAVLNPVLDHFVVVRPDGKSFSFNPNGSPKDTLNRNLYNLTVLASGYTLTDGITTETYNANGALVSIARPGLPVISLTYDSQQRLSEVRTGSMYTLQFAYDPLSGKIARVHANQTLALTYQYLAQGILGSVTTLGEGSGVSRRYIYDDPNYPNLLTDIIDENQNRFASWRYNALGQAIESKHAGDVDKVSLTFGVNGSSRYTDEVDALGTTRRYNFNSISNGWYLSSNTQPGGSGCNAASSALTYDAKGNISKRVDFKGNSTTYLYDNDRNLELSRVEAEGSPQARTITTQWHPALRLPSKITEPGRITEFTYSNKGLLTQKQVTDTTAVTPQVRTTTYSYEYNTNANDPFIKKITVDGPRGDALDWVVYEYNGYGNLSKLSRQTTENTTLITTYDNYDSFGRVGKIVDANGQVTILTYTPRGWLKTRVTNAGSTTPLTTSFDYDGVGQLIKVTLSDSSTVTYTYDAAHRLTDIVDASGNRIHYTLDNAGNRTKEEVTDSSGVLAALLLQIQTAQADAQLPHAGEAI